MTMRTEFDGANQPYKQNSESETGQECPEKAQKGAKEGETTLQAGVDMSEEKKSDSRAFEEIRVGDVYDWGDGTTFTVEKIDHSLSFPIKISYELEGETVAGAMPLDNLSRFEWVDYKGDPSAEESSAEIEEPAQEVEVKQFLRQVNAGETLLQKAKLNQRQPERGETVWIPVEFFEEDRGSQYPWSIRHKFHMTRENIRRPDRWHVGENLPVFSQNQDSGGLLGEFRRLAATQLEEIDKILGIKKQDHEERMMQLEILTSDKRDILAMEKELDEANKLMEKATEELRGYKSLIQELAEAKKKIEELQSDLTRKDDLIIELRSDNDVAFEAGEQFARANFDAFPYAEQFETEIEEALAEQVWRICCAICWESPWNDQGKWQGSLDCLPELKRILNAIYTPKPFDPLRKVVHELTEFETLARLVNCLIKEERKPLFVYRDHVDQEVGK